MSESKRPSRNQLQKASDLALNYPQSTASDVLALLVCEDPKIRRVAAAPLSDRSLLQVLLDGWEVFDDWFRFRDLGEVQLRLFEFTASAKRRVAGHQWAWILLVPDRTDTAPVSQIAERAAQISDLWLACTLHTVWGDIADPAVVEAYAAAMARLLEMSETRHGPIVEWSDLVWLTAHGPESVRSWAGERAAANYDNDLSAYLKVLQETPRSNELDDRLLYFFAGDEIYTSAQLLPLASDVIEWVLRYGTVTPWLDYYVSDLAPKAYSEASKRMERALGDAITRSEPSEIFRLLAGPDLPPEVALRIGRRTAN